MPSSLFKAMESRRRDLGMSMSVLAEHSGVSLPTVVRILSGRSPAASVDNVAKIADALGLSIQAKKKSRQEVLRAQAERKAKMLIGLLQGTSGLEGQALAPKALREFQRRTTEELLAGPRRVLWSK